MLSQAKIGLMFLSECFFTSPRKRCSTFSNLPRIINKCDKICHRIVVLQSRKVSKPELTCGTLIGGAEKRRVSWTVLSKVILVIFSSRLPIKITMIGAKPTVTMRGSPGFVSPKNCAVGTLISKDIDKLRQKAEVAYSIDGLNGSKLSRETLQYSL